MSQQTPRKLQNVSVSSSPLKYPTSPMAGDENANPNISMPQTPTFAKTMMRTPSKRSPYMPGECFIIYLTSRLMCVWRCVVVAWFSFLNNRTDFTSRVSFELLGCSRHTGNHQCHAQSSKELTPAWYVCRRTTEFWRGKSLPSVPPFPSSINYSRHVQPSGAPTWTFSNRLSNSKTSCTTLPCQTDSVMTWVCLLHCGVDMLMFQVIILLFHQISVLFSTINTTHGWLGIWYHLCPCSISLGASFSPSMVSDSDRVPYYPRLLTQVDSTHMQFHGFTSVERTKSIASIWTAWIWRLLARRRICLINWLSIRRKLCWTCWTFACVKYFLKYFPMPMSRLCWK